MDTTRKRAGPRGFTLTHLVEWWSTPERVDALPALDDERDRPMTAIFAERQ
ncbi:hypothetical protein [Burkholderia cenocepacia]|uniref:hypothetical protein n=1 Tax=Burkholderia cenocepacia TaxID=95486 RepID=UPI0021AB87DF|nr:hypothetical protein [Burkholderia cenocepacia]